MMMATSMWSKFIECRINYDSLENEHHMNFFDQLGRTKRSKKIPNLLKVELEEPEKLTYECREPHTSGYKEYFLYDGNFPKLTDQYFTDRTSKAVNYNNWTILKYFESGRNLKSLYQSKLAKCMFESINTLWFVCLEIFIKNKSIKLNNTLYNYAFDKVFNIHSEGQMINIQILMTVAYLNGYFSSLEDYNKLTRKYKKIISKFNLTCGLLAKYYTGMRHRADFENRHKLRSVEEPKFEIPVSVRSHFETNLFCSKCNMYIPEELILAKFSPNPSEQMIECPNLVCKFKFQPKFNTLKLKEKGQSNEKKRYKLLSPLRLLKKVGDFLFVRKEFDLFNPDKSNHLYWNLLFWFNFMGLPSFFVQ